jgi:hypothetical protein
MKSYNQKSLVIGSKTLFLHIVSLAWIFLHCESENEKSDPEPNQKALILHWF